MSALAAVMLAGGAKISGSDLRDTEEAEALRQAGAQVTVGHDAANIGDGLDGVIISSAVTTDNIEVQSALKRQVPVVRRLHALGVVWQTGLSLGVTGTHGKSTTSAMLATILRQAGKDPSYVIGARCPHLGGNAHLGRGEFFVAEVDESDGVIVDLAADVAVVTNIGCDHLATYGSIDGVVQGFSRFLERCDHVVLNIDDPRAADLSSRFPKHLSVGTSDDADVRATGIVQHEFDTWFDLWIRGKHCGRVRLPAPGVHNVLNALCAAGGAIAVGRITPEQIIDGLEAFQRPRRRFQLLEQNGVIVVDDYAHLPEEVSATLDAIRSGWPSRRVVAVFQPHRYTRTVWMEATIGAAFQRADLVVVAPIYAAGEDPIPGVTTQCVVDAIRRETLAETYSMDSADDIVPFLKTKIRKGDFLISFGAGDISRVTEQLSADLEEARFCAA
ncbi:UDP-N-acetylmuramate--L-alanine ligase [Candidatus Bipolaricaulota bacterium]|nr:UDP-N-acetylmuramate--L-alanine ligase [Candidatus Bipolaricaulota bacterium]